MKRSTYHIKTLAASKAVPVNSDRDASTRVPLNKKERTGVPTACKQQGNKNPSVVVSRVTVYYERRLE